MVAPVVVAAGAAATKYGPDVVREVKKRMPAVWRAARNIVAKAGPQTKAAVVDALKQARLSKGKLEITGYTAPIIVQAAARADRGMVPIALDVLNRHLDEAGVSELVASITQATAQAMQYAESHVSNRAAVTDGEALTKASIIRRAARLVGGVENLEVLVVAFSNLRPTDITAFKAARDVYAA